MQPLTILKIGGNVIDYPDLLEPLLDHFTCMGGHKALVHGGGKIASQIMRQMGLEPRMVNGRRITDRATLDILTMVYAGLLNKKMVASLQAR
ncbi:MAG: acetylglutamate kinase, partial [Bacteroidales bacterium]|nr:acetylglutamate kinase [Bacteroidales bacterium]